MADRYDSLLAEGLLSLQQHDVDTALYLFDLAAFEAPERVEARYYLGQAQARAGRVDEAERTLTDVLAREPSFIPARFELAVLYYHAGRNEEALKSFEQVRKADPERARVYLYEGRILQRLGRPKEAVAVLQRAAALDPGLALEANDEAGRAALAAGDPAAAQVAFRRAAEVSPAADAARAQTAPPGRTAAADGDEPRLALRLSLGVFYDDNVILDPGITSSGAAGITDQADTLGVLYLWGRYRWLDTERWIGRAEYGFYQNRHRDESLTPFDLQNHRLVLGAGRRFGRGELTAQYELQYALLGGEPYLTTHAVGPRLVLPETDRLVAEIRYQTGGKRFHDDQSFFALNSERDALFHRLDLTQYAVWDKTRYLFAGYTFERELAGDGPTEDDWSFNAHHLRAGLTWPIWASLRVDLDAAYIMRAYDNPNQQPPFAVRDDREFNALAGLTQPLARYLEVSLQYLHQDHQSNIPGFDFTRRLYGVLLTAKY